MKRYLTLLYIGLLVSYLIVLFVLTMMPPAHPAEQRVHLVPFYMIARDIYYGGWRFLINTLGNIVAFMPLGILVSVLRGNKTSLLLVALSGCALSAAIEVLQWNFTQRVLDIDDVILNTLGAIAGYMCYTVIERIQPRWAHALLP